jgi:hypothetical protein
VTRMPSSAEVEARLLEASRRAGSLRPEDRLATKLDLSASGIAARLQEASDLLEVCLALARAGAAWRGTRFAGSHDSSG